MLAGKDSKDTKSDATENIFDAMISKNKISFCDREIGLIEFWKQEEISTRNL